MALKYDWSFLPYVYDDVLMNENRLKMMNAVSWTDVFCREKGTGFYERDFDMGLEPLPTLKEPEYARFPYEGNALFWKKSADHQDLQE